MFSDDGEAAAAELNAIPMSDNAWNMTYSNSKNVNRNDSNNNYTIPHREITRVGCALCPVTKNTVKATAKVESHIENLDFYLH